MTAINEFRASFRAVEPYIGGKLFFSKVELVEPVHYFSRERRGNSMCYSRSRCTHTEKPS